MPSSRILPSVTGSIGWSKRAISVAEQGVEHRAAVGCQHQPAGAVAVDQAAHHHRSAVLPVTPAWAHSVPLARQKSSMRSGVERSAATTLEGSFIDPNAGCSDDGTRFVGDHFQEEPRTHSRDGETRLHGLGKKADHLRRISWVDGTVRVHGDRIDRDACSDDDEGDAEEFRECELLGIRVGCAAPPTGCFMSASSQLASPGHGVVREVLA
jgi:hypothetical protein